MPRIVIRTWTDAELHAAIETADSVSDVLRGLKLGVTGGNHCMVSRHIKRLGLSTVHFTRTARIRGLRRAARPLPFDMIFRENSFVASVGRYVVKYKVIPYLCEQCGNAGLHNGKPLSLQVDHRNGIRNDHRIDNLRYLCPNCHAQTDTFAGKNTRGRRTGVGRLRKIRKSQRKVPYAQLVSRYKELGTYRAVAVEFGVSDVTVRKAVHHSKIETQEFC